LQYGQQAIGYAKFRSRSHHAVIRVYDEAGNVIETHGHAGDFKAWWVIFSTARLCYVFDIDLSGCDSTGFAKKQERAVQ